MVQPERKYDATVVTASLMESQNKGTPSVFIKFNTEDGTIDYDAWTTEAAIEYTTKNLLTLGATEEGLRSWDYLEKIGEHLQGAECEITTVSETYKGKPITKVKWINPRRRKRSANLAGRVAQLFGGPAAPEESPIVDDESVPF